MTHPPTEAGRIDPPQLDVLLVIRACVDHFPPTLNQANILAEQGLRVGIVQLASPEPGVTGLRPSVTSWEIYRSWNSKKEPAPGILRRWGNWMRYHNSCRHLIERTAPKIVIAYDLHGCAHVRPEGQRRKTVCHLHEHWNRDIVSGFGHRLSLWRLHRLLRCADRVVVPDKYRAERLREEAALASLPKVVMNCPRRMERVPDSPLREVLGDSLREDVPVVGYLGSIGPNQGVCQAALSMRHWPGNAVFVLVGGYSSEMRETVLSHAGAFRSRVVFLGPRPHVEALALTAGLDLGLSLIQPRTLNWVYSSGALNKRFEYMALGVPQITNQSPGVPEMMKETGGGVCVDPTSAEAIGQAVSSLLGSADTRLAMGRKAREAHLGDYNYECQFAQMADWVLAQCRAQ